MNSSLTLMEMALALTNAEIYKLVADQIVGQAEEMDFNTVVGSIDDIGGTDAWVTRVTDLAVALEIDAYYVIAVDTMLPMHLVRRMYKAEGLRLNQRARTEAIEERKAVEAAEEAAFVARRDGEDRYQRGQDDDKLLAELDS